jgi:hypothetical protein
MQSEIENDRNSKVRSATLMCMRARRDNSEGSEVKTVALVQNRPDPITTQSHRSPALQPSHFQSANSPRIRRSIFGKVYQLAVRLGFLNPIVKLHSSTASFTGTLGVLLLITPQTPSSTYPLPRNSEHAPSQTRVISFAPCAFNDEQLLLLSRHFRQYAATGSVAIAVANLTAPGTSTERNWSGRGHAAEQHSLGKWAT